MFVEQIGNNMEVYVDDMLVKSKHNNNHADDLVECFAILQKYNMRLNPQKCSFGVSSGKFLEFIVNCNALDSQDRYTVCL